MSTRPGRRAATVLTALVLFLCFGDAARADVWDLADPDDSGFGSTRNELVHGSRQVHDVGAGATGPDLDTYRGPSRPYTSYEVIAEAATGDLDLFVRHALVLFDLGAREELPQGRPVSGHARSASLRWVNGAGTNPGGRGVALFTLGCSPVPCDAADTYEIRALETTIGVARFNNSASQSTVLLAQNASRERTTAEIHFWSGDGALLHTAALDLDPRALLVLNLALVPDLAGKGGSITIAHDAPYGLLNVKAIALESETGFSFDSPGVYRGH